MISPTNLPPVARQAEEARTGGRVQQAIPLYKAAVRQRPRWSEGWWWLGSLYYEQDRFAEAREAFQRFVGVARDPAPAFAFLGLCHYELGEYDAALDYFRQWARKKSPGPQELVDVATFHWALLLTRGQHFVQALYLLSPKAASRGRSPAMVEAMGLASLRMANLPQDYPPELREVVWLAGEAAAYSALYDVERSQEYARRLLLHYSAHPNVHYLRGMLLTFGKRNADEAAAEFEQELRISPGHVPAMLELARIRLEGSQAAEGLRLAEAAAAAEPKNVAARHMLGRALLETGDTQRAIRELESAREMAPDSAPIRFHLARAYRAQGRSAEADRELAAFRSLQSRESPLGVPEDSSKAIPESRGTPK